MRRRPRLLAALGAGSVVVVCAVVMGVSIAVASPRGAAGSDGDARIPGDLVWTWVQHCELTTGVELGSNLGWFSTEEDGELVVEYGTMDDEGEMTVDEEITAVVGACITTRQIDLDGEYVRNATTAERIEIYDWAVRWQKPCLAAHGMDVQLGSPRDFLDETVVPWYLLNQYVWTGTDGLADIDFDALLEARLACPPIPAHLAAQGIGW